MNVETWLYSNFDTIPYGDTDMRINCPFCKNRTGIPDTSHHLHISIVKPVSHCFRCGYKASWTRLVMDISGATYKEALDELKDTIIPLYVLRRQMAVAQRPGVSTMPKEFSTISAALAMGGLAARSALMAKLYIERRLEGIADWGLYLDQWGVWTDSSGFGKLVFPVEDGWWQYRNLRKSATIRYVSCSAPKGNSLYNYKALEQEHVMIAEGIISAACLGTNAVALCGRIGNPTQIERLGNSLSTKKYTICLDADAKQQALNLAQELLEYGKEVWIRFYSTGDPATIGNSISIRSPDSMGNPMSTGNLIDTESIENPMSTGNPVDATTIRNPINSASIRNSIKTGNPIDVQYSFQTQVSLSLDKDFLGK